VDAKGGGAGGSAGCGGIEIFRCGAINSLVKNRCGLFLFLKREN
jgi:hypothetical protein